MILFYIFKFCLSVINGPEEFEEAFNFLYGLAYDHSKHLQTLENEAFILLKAERAAEQE